MKKVLMALIAALFMGTVFSCNNGMSSGRDDSSDRRRPDRSQRTVIDSAEYIDFTTEKYNANAVKREEMLSTLSGGSYKNGNSYIKINSLEGTIEINSDSGFYNGKENCQVYGVFGLEILPASNDCLYIRRNPRVDGFVMIDGLSFKNDAMPDLAVCIPLYGYSRNRIEVSSVMNGYIAMPSGTYWKK